MSLESQALKEMIIEDCKSSLYVTAKVLCGYNDINPRTHKDMIDTLENKALRKLICMPRGSLKSSIGVVAYSIWRLINNPNLRIIIDSELYTNSKNSIREIKAQLQKPIFTELFGDPIGSVWGEGEIIVGWRNQAKKEASCRAGGIEVSLVGQHADLLIADDLNSDNNSRTQEGRKKIIDHYKMLTSILDPGGEIVVIGTRYSSDDILGFILDNEVDPEDHPFKDQNKPRQDDSGLI